MEGRAFHEIRLGQLCLSRPWFDFECTGLAHERHRHGLDDGDVFQLNVTATDKPLHQLVGDHRPEAYLGRLLNPHPHALRDLIGEAPCFNLQRRL